MSSCGDKGGASARENGPSFPEKQRTNSGNSGNPRGASGRTVRNALDNTTDNGADTSAGSGGNAAIIEDEENDRASFMETESVETDGIGHMPGDELDLPAPNLPYP